jgi:hypothetical protein
MVAYERVNVAHCWWMHIPALNAVMLKQTIGFETSFFET